MDMGDKDKFGLERSGDLLNYHPAGISTDWQLGNLSTGIVLTGMPVGQGAQRGSPQCPSVSMSESLPPIWSNPGTSYNLHNFCCPVRLFGASELSRQVADKESSHGAGLSGNESGMPGLNGGGQGEAANLANANKRKNTKQDMEFDGVQGASESLDGTAKESVDTKKGKQNCSTIGTRKLTGKKCEDSSEASKEEHINVRAQRGQKTNSHSLAERARRKKICERMKFLQDLVPGCSRVTGKAVMLDEIINYVQSLQRQVEFLSMKLATVSPRLDFNIEGLLSEHMLHSCGGPSNIGFSPDVIPLQLYPPDNSLVQTGILGISNPSDALRRAINSQLAALSGCKESTSQMPNAWDDTVQTTYGAIPALNVQDLNGKPHYGLCL